MSRPARQHRLPKRTGDYKLIPAPLDLSLPLVAEKSPLPAIIVTPSSPSHTRDFAIAFLAPVPPPPLRQRIALALPALKCPDLKLPKPIANPGTRARLLIFLCILVVVLFAHYITASVLGARYPHFDFVVQGAEAGWLTRGGEVVRAIPEASDAVAAALTTATPVAQAL